jgi:hypothetical protein
MMNQCFCIMLLMTLGRRGISAYFFAAITYQRSETASAYSGHFTSRTGHLQHQRHRGDTQIRARPPGVRADKPSTQALSDSEFCDRRHSSDSTRYSSISLSQDLTVPCRSIANKGVIGLEIFTTSFHQQSSNQKTNRNRPPPISDLRYRHQSHRWAICRVVADVSRQSAMRSEWG